MSGSAERGRFSTCPSIFLRLKASDPRPREIAWEEFRARYAPIIGGFARKLGARRQDTEDVIQDVMLGFYSASPTFVYDPANGRFRGYLKACTFRALRKRLGSNSKFKTVALGDLDSESPQVDQDWNETWGNEQLRAALRQMRQEKADVNAFRAFEQYAILGRPPTEVAQELGMSVNSVYKAKNRMMGVLREKMKGMEEEMG
jgi:RNA polymerase sigma-70 factor (ECF subfamily)